LVFLARERIVGAIGAITAQTSAKAFVKIGENKNAI
jgi:hypothetical protein